VRGTNLSLLEETPGDLTRKYQGSFVWYNKKLRYIGSFEKKEDGDTDPLCVAFMSKPGERRYTTEQVLDDDEIENIHFDSHFFNSQHWDKEGVTIPNEGLALKYERVPRRQWIRSLSPQTCLITTVIGPFMNTLGIATNNIVELQFSHVSQMIEPYYPSYNKAIDLLPRVRTIALSPNLALLPSPYEPDVIYIRSLFALIGKAEPDRIKVYHNGSYQEVLDYVKRSNETIQVELCQIT